MWLHRTEEEVWKLTPRKLQALLKVHYDIRKATNKQQGTEQVNGFIDEIPGW